jgi:nucleotide-binding universal stress UspA family protein
MYSNILVPIDGSDTANLGLGEAIKLAQDQGARLRLFHVVNELILTSYDAAFALPQVIDGLRAAGAALVEDAEAKVRRAGIEVDSLCKESIGGQAGVHIVDQATAWPADLIVMGTHGRRGIRRMVMGSDAEYVVRHTPVPVLLIRGQASSHSWN